jgi:acetyltransferase
MRSQGAIDPPWVDEFTLADGPVVRFRHVRPSDESLISDAISTASRETLLHRFFSPIRKVSPELLRKMLEIDRQKETCIVGLIQIESVSRLICGARYIKLPRPGAAEIALTVHDDFQRRGLGTFLLNLLIRLARAEGMRWFEADVMSSNTGMLRLLEKAGPPSADWRQGIDVKHLVLDLEKAKLPG